MKLIIDIPEDEYNAIKNTAFVEDEKTMFRQSANDRKCTMGLFHIVDEIKNGTPIPDNATVCDIEQIRAKIADLEKKTIEDVCLDECRPCVYTTFEYVRQVIDKYK